MKQLVEVETMQRYTHYDSDLEGAILGAILLEKNCLINVIGLLNEDLFYYEANKFIYRTLIWMWEKGWNIDILTVAVFVCRNGLDKWQKVSQDSAPYYISRLTNIVVSTANIETHCLLLRQMYINRLLFQAKFSNEYSLDAALETKKKIDEAFNIGTADSWLSIEEVITKKLIPKMNDAAGYKIIETSFKKLNDVSPVEAGDYIIIGARPSVGKCLGLGTKIIMYDGTKKNVEDINIGDLLMGDDSTPRKVLSTTTGRELMYKIKQVRGIEYRVNESHVLSLMASRNQALSKHGDKIDMPLKKYLQQTKKFRNNWKGYKVSINFNEQRLIIPPYLLGLWLGDGSIGKPEISKPDEEIMNYLSGYSDGANYKFKINEPLNKCKSYRILAKTRKDNPFVFKLKELGVLNNKHIPKEYIINSKENRLQLLAGLIDTDGYLEKSGCYTIVQKSEKLINDIKYLCDTLGFRTTIKPIKKSIKSISFIGNYFLLCISGDLTTIPVKIKRKKWREEKIKRDWHISGLTIEKDIVDDYYGFELNGNGRFLLEDCTVTHNTAIAMQMASDIALKGNSVGIISLETKGDKLAARMLAAQTQIEFWRIWKNKMFEDQKQNFYNNASSLSNLPLYIFDKPTVNHIDIRIAANKIRRKVKGNLVLFVDYIQLVAPEEKSKLDRRLQINEISRALKLICMELENTSVIALAQLTRDAAKEPPRMHHLKESGALEQDAEKIWLLHRDKDEEEKLKGQGITTFDASLFVEKNKEGWTGEISLEFQAEQMTFKEKNSEIILPQNFKPARNFSEPKSSDDFDDGFNEQPF